MANEIQKRIEQIIQEGRFLKLDETPEKALAKLEEVLYRRATEKEMTVDIKTHRILNIPENDQLLLMQAIEQSPELMLRFQQEGVIYKQEVTTKQHLPDTDLAKFIHAVIRGEMILQSGDDS